MNTHCSSGGHFRYEFRYKVDRTTKRPPIIWSFHLPGLDWRLWFLGPMAIYGGVLTFTYHSINYSLSLLTYEHSGKCHA